MNRGPSHAFEGIEQTRLPLDPLAALADGNLTELARRLGVPARRVQDWRANGVPYYRADELAARLGFLAYELWPMFDTIPDYQHGWQHPSVRDQEQTA